MTSDEVLIQRLCNKCRKNPRTENPRTIYCEECLGKEQLEIMRFRTEMNYTPCPQCGVEIGIHAEYGLMKCLNDVKKSGYAFSDEKQKLETVE